MLEERTKAYRRLRLTLPTSAAGNAAAAAAAADGQILLEPRDGATHGDGIHQGDGDIGYWNSPFAYVTWVADTRAAGPYAIHLTYACGDACGGDFEVTIGRQHFKSHSS